MRLEHEHDPEAIARRLEGGPRVNYLRDWIYGGIDGAVTTFAIVAGVVGADLSSGVAIVLGVANLLADGFSMAAANYSGTKAERDDYRRLRRMEERHIDTVPEGEREEVRQIYSRKGYSAGDLSRIVSLITSRRQVWLDTMLEEEHGVSPVLRHPVKAALATFSAFVICGCVPLLPFAFGVVDTAMIATLLTGLVFLMIGAAKSVWSTQHWLTSAVETFVIGMTAAGIAWCVGFLLERFVNGG
ncbi:hypothetical protein GR183_19540 [Stappia sp. GBMRC 2046]|uniref:TIGR00267 family protein n=1 Tax=Stappia sediminis TaxID=2692190 RepID=A0A7X3S9P4_9HYPH|nr:VIT1/CCC1 transporter family protein [Stappia sediminis]MXN67108.1 hypothetical protein [Stappia sediminis]